MALDVLNGGHITSNMQIQSQEHTKHASCNDRYVSFLRFVEIEERDVYYQQTAFYVTSPVAFVHADPTSNIRIYVDSVTHIPTGYTSSHFRSVAPRTTSQPQSP